MVVSLFCPKIVCAAFGVRCRSIRKRILMSFYSRNIIAYASHALAMIFLEDYKFCGRWHLAHRRKSTGCIRTRRWNLLFRSFRRLFFRLFSLNGNIAAETMIFGFYFQSPAAADADVLSKRCRRTLNEDIDCVLQSEEKEEDVSTEREQYFFLSANVKTKVFDRTTPYLKSNLIRK